MEMAGLLLQRGVVSITHICIMQSHVGIYCDYSLLERIYLGVSFTKGDFKRPTKYHQCNKLNSSYI